MRGGSNSVRKNQQPMSNNFLTKSLQGGLPTHLDSVTSGSNKQAANPYANNVQTSNLPDIVRKSYNGAINSKTAAISPND